ncbi:hypothetical protein ACFV4N_41665 [Actinosynnema sp. NPDC059797]
MSALTVPFFTRSDTFTDLWEAARRHIVEVVEKGEFPPAGEALEFKSEPASHLGAPVLPPRGWA